MALSTLKIIVFGEEWTGKSSVGNIILRKEAFDVNTGTQCTSLGTAEVGDRSVVVVDSPGWDPLCSEVTPLKVLAEACHSLGQCGPDSDPHALLLTIPVSTDPEWNQRISERLKRLFSPRIWRQTILLFTRPGCLNGKSIEYHLEHAGRAFQSLLERCGNRYHTFSTLTEDHEEVTSLLDKIEKMVEENCGESLNTKEVSLEMREKCEVRMEQLTMSSTQSNVQLEQILMEREELKLHCGPHNGLRIKEENIFVEHEGGEVFTQHRYQEENVTRVSELPESVEDELPQQLPLSLVSTERNRGTEVQKVRGCGFGVTRPELPEESLEIILFLNMVMEVDKVKISVWLLAWVKLQHGSKFHWEIISAFVWWQIVVVNRCQDRSGTQRKAILPGPGEPQRNRVGEDLKDEEPPVALKSWDPLPDIDTGEETRKVKGEERRPRKLRRSSSLHRDFTFVKDLDDGRGIRKLKRFQSCERIIKFDEPGRSTGQERGRETFKSTKIKVTSPVDKNSTWDSTTVYMPRMTQKCYRMLPSSGGLIQV